MRYGKEIRSKDFAFNPHFNYLPDGDRYLLARDKPRYKFNVIGTGVNGQEHMRVTHLEGRATIHGIYDPNPRSIETAIATNAAVAPHDELKVYESEEAACSDPDVDGLIICTPNYTHLKVVETAAKSGKHILLEKPISTTLADAHAITQIAECYSAVFQIGLQYRYKAMYAEAIHEGLERRSLGDIKMVSIREHRIPFLDKVNQWNKFAKYSGDTLVEKCCHYFDLLNMFAGARPIDVYASGSMAVNFKEFEYNGEKSDILDSAYVIVNYANGVRANFDLCMFAPMFFEELIVLGDAGRLMAQEHRSFVAGGQNGSTLEVTLGDNQPSRKMDLAYPTLIEESGHGGATYFEHVNFIDNIDGKETKTASAHDGLWSIIVAAAAQASIKRGAVVSIEQFLAEHELAMSLP